MRGAITHRFARRLVASAAAGSLLGSLCLSGAAAVVTGASSDASLGAGAPVDQVRQAVRGKALDAALRGKLSIDGNNLDLLLEMPRSLTPSLARPGDLALPVAGAVLGTHANLPLALAPQARPQRDWEHAAARAMGGGGGSVDGSTAAPQVGSGDPGDPGLPAAPITAVRAPVRWLVQTARDNLALLLGGAGLVLMLGVLVKALSRRI